MSEDPEFSPARSLATFRDECVASLTDSLAAFTSYPKLRAAIGRHVGTGRLMSDRAPCVVAIGKAALSMCSAVASILGEIERGVAVVPVGYAAAWAEQFPWNRRLDIVEGAHPVSDSLSCAASAAVEETVAALTERDTLIVLLSGGGSALVGCPIDGLATDTYGSLLNQLYRSGAPIGQVNIIRQGLSRLAGGGLLARAAPANVYAYVLSDVPGDRLATVASGPCSVASPDEASRTRAAITPLLGQELASLAADRLRRNALHAGYLACLELVGANRDLLSGVQDQLERRGIRVVAQHDLVGEATDCGMAEGAAAAEALRPGEAILLGGECTVTVTGNGRGGRSQEFVLAAAKALHHAQCTAVVASLGSDGYDGPTDAAGAVLISDDAHMAAIADRVTESLRQNDAYPILEEVEGLLFTGPTHTNVMDIALIARPPQ